MAFLQRSGMPEPQAPPAPEATPTSDSQSSLFSQRSRRQLGLFCAGAGFFAITSFITRRSIVRRYKASIPKFYQPSNRPSIEVNGTIEAVEALNIATINVLSVSMMVAGGLLWCFDISSMQDLKRRVRGPLGVDRTEQDADEEMEEWVATVLARKDKKGNQDKANNDRSGTR